MNSQEIRKVKASAASTTRFMPARNSRIERQHALRRFARAGHSRARTGSPPTAPRSTTTRKNAPSASMRKCAPSQGRPSGSVVDDGRLGAEQMVRRQSQQEQGGGKACAIDDPHRHRRSAGNQREHRGRELGGDARQREGQRHGGGPLRRTPRPLPVLVAFSEISSMPAASSAATSFISESTLPRMTPSLASMR